MDNAIELAVQVRGKSNAYALAAWVRSASNCRWASVVNKSGPNYLLTACFQGRL